MPHAVEYAADSTLSHHRARRAQIEVLLSRAKYLNDRDRVIIEQVYEKEIHVQDLARLMGVPKRTMYRRIQSIIKKLKNPTYLFVASRLDILPRHLQGVAKLHILEGKTLRQTVAKTGLSLHRVRQYDMELRTMAKHLPTL